MSNTTISSKNNNSSANFLASLFLSSKRCLKPIYGFKSYHIAIIRYICDSIDKTYRKTGKLQTRLYQSQIATYTFLSRKTVNESIKHLLKKRIIRLVDKSVISIGKVLLTCNPQLHGIDVSPTVTRHRYVTHGYTSNSSNITNRGEKLSTGIITHMTDKNRESGISNIRNIKDIINNSLIKKQTG